MLVFLLSTAVTSLAVVPSITVTIKGSGEFTEDITFDYLIADSDSLDVDLLIEFDIGNGFILKAPDANRWRLEVSNAGVLSAALV